MHIGCDLLHHLFKCFKFIISILILQHLSTLHLLLLTHCPLILCLLSQPLTLSVLLLQLQHQYLLICNQLIQSIQLLLLFPFTHCCDCLIIQCGITAEDMLEFKLEHCVLSFQIITLADLMCIFLHMLTDVLVMVLPVLMGHSYSLLIVL